MAEPYPATRPASIFPAATGAQQWYAIQVGCRHEKNVTAALQQRSVPSFLPLVTEIHRWSDRRKKVDMPLFAGYTFVRFATNEERLVVLRTPGVVRLVGKEYVGSPIPTKQVQDVWMLVNCQLKIDPHPFLNVGDRIRIRSGSLAGVEGILIGKNSDATLVVSVDMLQRSVSVRIDGFDVERLTTAAPAQPLGFRTAA